MNNHASSAKILPMTPAKLRAELALALREVLWQGNHLDSVIDNYSSLIPRDAAGGEQLALFHDLLYGSVRYFHQLNQLALCLLEKPLKKKDDDVLALLIAGIYQLRYSAIKTHAIVHETVSATVFLKKKWARAVVNACLRRYQREEQKLEARLADNPEFSYSHSAWMISQIKAEWPKQAKAIFEANNNKPPIFLRVNNNKISRRHYLEELDKQGCKASPVSLLGDAILLHKSIRVSELPGYSEGWFSVQDAGAQLCGDAMQIEQGQRILDACAAPGGKLSHILEIAAGDCEVWAIEQSKKRYSRMATNLGRLGLQAKLILADARQPETWWDGKPFDRILLDTPCSAIGVIRRNPDIKVHRQLTDISNIQELQTRLLDQLWPLLGQGGKLLYVTCSILAGENDNQVESFIKRHSGSASVSLPIFEDNPETSHKLVHGYQILPGENNMDGFYYACIQKQ